MRLLLVTVLLAAFPAAAQDVDEATGLVRAPGWELVRANCGGCHSYQLVTAQRADRQTWQDTIRWMQATQNLWQFDPATEEAILDYLAASYPPRPERRRAPIPPSLMPPATDSQEEGRTSGQPPERGNGELLRSLEPVAIRRDAEDVDLDHPTAAVRL